MPESREGTETGKTLAEVRPYAQSELCCLARQHFRACPTPTPAVTGSLIRNVFAFQLFVPERTKTVRVSASTSSSCLSMPPPLPRGSHHSMITTVAQESKPKDGCSTGVARLAGSFFSGVGPISGLGSQIFGSTPRVDFSAGALIAGSERTGPS